MTNMNSETEVQLRRFQNSLRASGGGVIAFGLWSVLKIYLSFFFSETTFGDVIRESLEDAPSDAPPEVELVLWVALLGAAFILGAIVFSVHLYVGLRARREAREDGRKGPVYLILTGFFVIMGIVSICLTIRYIFTGEQTINTPLVTLMVDLTSLYIYLDLIRSAVKVRQLRGSAAVVEGV